MVLEPGVHLLGYIFDARVAELVDALDLGSSGATRESSSLSFRTNSYSEVSGGKIFGPCGPGLFPTGRAG